MHSYQQADPLSRRERRKQRADARGYTQEFTRLQKERQAVRERERATGHHRAETLALLDQERAAMRMREAAVETEMKQIRRSGEAAVARGQRCEAWAASFTVPEAGGSGEIVESAERRVWWPMRLSCSRPVSSVVLRLFVKQWQLSGSGSLRRLLRTGELMSLLSWGRGGVWLFEKNGEGMGFGCLGKNASKYDRYKLTPQVGTVNELTPPRYKYILLKLTPKVGIFIEADP